MQFQRLFLLCCLVATSQTWAMKSTLNKYGFSQKFASLSQVYNKASVSAFMTNVPSAFKSLTNKTTQLKQRSFEAVKPLVSRWETVSLPLQADNEQIDFLCKALEEKIIKGKNSSVYSNLSLEELIEKIASKGFINEENNQGLTPLQIILNGHKRMTDIRQEDLLNLLKQSGANLGDQKAFDIAIQSHNSAAIRILKPYVNTEALYFYIIEIKQIINQREKELAQCPGNIFGTMKKANILAQKKTLAALEQKPKKKTVKTVTITQEGKESEITTKETYEEYLPRMFNAMVERLKTILAKK